MYPWREMYSTYPYSFAILFSPRIASYLLCFGLYQILLFPGHPEAEAFMVLQHWAHFCWHCWEPRSLRDHRVSQPILFLPGLRACAGYSSVALIWLLAEFFGDSHSVSFHSGLVLSGLWALGPRETCRVNNK